MVFDPDLFAKRVIELQADLWGAFMNWYMKKYTLGGFLDAAMNIQRDYDQYFLDLQKGSE